MATIKCLVHTWIWVEFALNSFKHDFFPRHWPSSFSCLYWNRAVAVCQNTHSDSKWHILSFGYGGFFLLDFSKNTTALGCFSESLCKLMKCMIFLHWLTSSVALGVSWKGVTSRSISVHCLSRSNHKTKEERIKTSVGRREKRPICCSIYPSLVGDFIIYILIYGDSFISISTSQAQSEDRFRPWTMNSPKVKTFPIWNHNFLSCQYKAVNPLCICSSQRAQKSLLRSRMTNTSYCHRTESVRDKDHHCPLHCVPQLLSSVTN